MGFEGRRQRSRKRYKDLLWGIIISSIIFMLWRHNVRGEPIVILDFPPTAEHQSSYSRATIPRPEDFHNPRGGRAQGDQNMEKSPDAPPIVYRPSPLKEVVPPPIEDNFPLAAAAHSPTDLPPVPPWNVPPAQHVDYATPLMIGFTRNWRLLQQCVVSYIAAGWPPSDIYVIDNTGTMHSNKNGQLSLQNPFFLNHTRLVDIYQVNVIQTPALLTFAQLQNFYTFTAVSNNWTQYFWSHMDTLILSDEEYDFTDEPFKSIYMRCVDALEASYANEGLNWAARWFHYDYLTLVRTQAYVDVGGWDTAIPYYQTDCDMHERIWMHGFTIKDVHAGLVGDVNTALDDLGILFERDDAFDPEPVNLKLNMEKAEKPQESIDWVNKGAGKGKRLYLTKEVEEGEKAKRDTTAEEISTHRIRNLYSRSPSLLKRFPLPPAHSPTTPQLNSLAYQQLLTQYQSMEASKGAGNNGGRNGWQRIQNGGQGEPFYVDHDGFQRGLQAFTDMGLHTTWMEKWGIEDCSLRAAGLTEGDAWRVEMDWRGKGMQERLREERRKGKEEVERGNKQGKKGKGGEANEGEQLDSNEEARRGNAKNDKGGGDGKSAKKNKNKNKNSKTPSNHSTNLKPGKRPKKLSSPPTTTTPKKKSEHNEDDNDPPDPRNPVPLFKGIDLDTRQGTKTNNAREVGGDQQYPFADIDPNKKPDTHHPVPLFKGIDLDARKESKKEQYPFADIDPDKKPDPPPPSKPMPMSIPRTKHHGLQ